MIMYLLLVFKFCIVFCYVEVKSIDNQWISTVTWSWLNQSLNWKIKNVIYKNAITIVDNNVNVLEFIYNYKILYACINMLII